MGNYDISFSDVKNIAAEVDSAISTVQTLLSDLQPIEAALPLPSSVKTGISDLEKFLAIAKKIADYADGAA